jgi:hypothetical protein
MVIARYAGVGLELDAVIAHLAPVQRDLIRAMLLGDDDPDDGRLATLHRVTLIELRRLRVEARARVRELLGLSRRSPCTNADADVTAEADPLR